MASREPVDAPDGTAARPITPLSSSTSHSTVGFPRLSRISRPTMSTMALIVFAPGFSEIRRRAKSKPPGRGPTSEVGDCLGDADCTLPQLRRHFGLPSRLHGVRQSRGARPPGRSGGGGFLRRVGGGVVRQRGLDEAGEQRMAVPRRRLELGVELHAHEPRMHVLRQLDDLGELLALRQRGDDQAGLLAGARDSARWPRSGGDGAR